MEMEAVLNDRVIISEKINSMSKEQIESEIKRLEKEAVQRKKMILSNRTNGKMAR